MSGENPNKIDEKPVENPPGEGTSKQAKRRRRRRALNGDTLPETNPDSPSNDDVSDMPNSAETKVDAKSTDKPTSKNPNKTKRKTKATSKFFGVEPNPMTIDVMTETLGVLQGFIGLPKELKVLTPNGIEDKDMRLANFECDVRVMNDVVDESGNKVGKVEVVKRTAAWVLARNVDVLSGGLVDKGIDYIDEHPAMAAIGSTLITTFTIMRSAQAIIEAINNAQKQAQQQDRTEKKDKGEGMKVEVMEQYKELQ